MRTPFLVLPCELIYNCISGRSILGRLEVVASTAHLKLKFYSLKDDVITLNADLISTQRCHILPLKSDQNEEPTFVRKPKKKKHGKEANVNLVELVTRYDPDSLEDEEDDTLTKELKKKIKRPEPNVEFLPI